MTHFERALNRLENGPDNDQKQTANAALWLGRTHAAILNGQEALDRLNQALDYFEIAGDRTGGEQIASTPVSALPGVLPDLPILYERTFKMLDPGSISAGWALVRFASTLCHHNFEYERAVMILGDARVIAREQGNLDLGERTNNKRALSNAHWHMTHISSAPDDTTDHAEMTLALATEAHSASAQMNALLSLS